MYCGSGWGGDPSLVDRSTMLGDRDVFTTLNPIMDEFGQVRLGF